MAPLPVQQAQAYPETVTGRFVSLADFENVPTGAARQVEAFSFKPAGEQASRRLVVNTTRTGAGAMEVTLPAGAQLVYTSPQIHDFTGYTLLSVAVYVEALRDDLRLTLTSGGASWRSLPTLLEPGWNTVLVDLRRLERMGDFDITNVRTVAFEFADAAGPVTFNVDDIMLIDNRRTLTGSPQALKVQKLATDYGLELTGGVGTPLELSQSEDGLWRLGSQQPVVQLAGDGQALPERTEQLEPLGGRRVGSAQVLECNKVRVRLASTWYFPGRAGEWASMSVRQVRWEHTIYGDGRRITHVELNNAGGQKLKQVRMIWPQEVALSGRGVTQSVDAKDVQTAVMRWDYLDSLSGGRTRMQQQFLQPGRVEVAIGVPDSLAPGDVNRDGFDESQGCYFLRAKSGQCRFRLLPPEGGLDDPVFRISGKWQEPPAVNCEGLAVEGVVRLEDGSILFTLPGRIMRATSVEVSGKVSYLDVER